MNSVYKLCLMYDMEVPDNTLKKHSWTDIKGWSPILGVTTQLLSVKPWVLRCVSKFLRLENYF